MNALRKEGISLGSPIHWMPRFVRNRLMSLPGLLPYKDKFRHCNDTSVTLLSLSVI